MFPFGDKVDYKHLMVESWIGTEQQRNLLYDGKHLGDNPIIWTFLLCSSFKIDVLFT